MANPRYENFGKEPPDMRAERIRRVKKIPKATGIYMITFLPGKVSYIGASKNIRKRIAEHFINMSISDEHNPMSYAYRCYGISAFRIDILEKCDVSSLKSCEQKYLTSAYFDGLKLWNTELLSGLHRGWKDG